jgi:hypothetical protein
MLLPLNAGNVRICITIMNGAKRRAIAPRSKLRSSALNFAVIPFIRRSNFNRECRLMANHRSPKPGL